MRRIGSFFVVLLISVGLLGGVAKAGTSNGATVPTVQSLLGKSFTSVKVNGNSSLGNRQLRVGFSGTSAKPRLLVRGGCNTWGARFVIRKGRLFLKGQATGTDMGCSKNPDPWIRGKLRKGMKVQARGGRLTLTRPAERVRFVFKLAAAKRQGPDHVAETPDYPFRFTVPATKEDVHGKEYELIGAIGEKVEKGLKLRFRDWLKADGEGKLVPTSSLDYLSDRDRVNGIYGIADGVLSWNDFCPRGKGCNGLYAPWLHDFFTSKPNIGLDGTDLVLRKDEVELVFTRIGEAQAPDPEPRVTVPARIEDVLDKSYEAISVIGPDLEMPLKISFTVATQTGHGDPVTGPALSYYAGCNHYGGWTDIENGTLSWTEVISTLIGCWGSQDEWLIPLFKNSPEIGLDGTDLVVRKNGVEIVFRETGS